jgi:SSS family solute:Na+ symporter
MSTETIIFIGVAIYIVVMMVVGIYAAKRNATAADFIVAGRRMPMFLCTATLIATWFGGSSMMGVSGAAYDGGLLGVIADPFGAALVLLIIGMFFARFYRRLRLMTFLELVEQRFGKVAATIATFTHLVSNIGWVGGMLVVFGLLFESLTGTPMHVGIFAGAAIVVAYTMIGGLWAVALTDAIQVGIILVGIIVLFAVVLIDAGGWGAIYARIPDGTFDILPVENSGERWLNYVRMWLIFGITDIGSQSLIGRAMAAKTERVAQNSFYFAGFGYLIIGMIPVLLGIIGSVTMPDLANSEAIVPSLAVHHLHPIAVSIFVGAILAAVMSTCDSALLAAGSVISRIVLPLVHKNPSDALTLRVTRLSIPALALVSIVVALNGRDIFDILVDANVPALAATAVPVIMVVWWRKANNIGALSAMAAGFLTWLVSRQIAPELPGDLIGMGVCLVTMVVVSLATQKIDPPKPARDIDGNVVEFKALWGILGFRS